MLLHHSHVLVSLSPVILGRSIRLRCCCCDVGPREAGVEVCFSGVRVGIVVCSGCVELALGAWIVAGCEVSVVAEVFLA